MLDKYQELMQKKNELKQDWVKVLAKIKRINKDLLLLEEGLLRKL